ncbi:24970_t:CDS:2, partial [Racocetra persica]
IIQTIWMTILYPVQNFRKNNSQEYGGNNNYFSSSQTLECRKANNFGIKYLSDFLKASKMLKYMLSQLVAECDMRESLASSSYEIS